MEEPCVMVCGGHVSGLDMVWRGHHDSGGVVDTMNQVVLWRESVTASVVTRHAGGPPV